MGEINSSGIHRSVEALKIDVRRTELLEKLFSRKIQVSLKEFEQILFGGGFREGKSVNIGVFEKIAALYVKLKSVNQKGTIPAGKVLFKLGDFGFYGGLHSKCDLEGV